MPSISVNSTDQQKLCYLMAWQSTNASTSKLMKFSSEKALCIDSGASCCISNDKLDFTTLTTTESSVLHGITSGLQIEGVDTIKWTLKDDSGHDITIFLPNSLYVPQAPMCLLSPQHMAQNTNSENDGFLCCGTSSVLTFSGFRRTILYNSTNNLPIIFFASDSHLITTPDSNSSAFLSSTSVSFNPPTNLTSAQRKLLHTHQKLGHLNFDMVQHLASSGALGSSFQSAGNCPVPLCCACIHGKQHHVSIHVYPGHSSSILKVT